MFSKIESDNKPQNTNTINEMIAKNDQEIQKNWTLITQLAQQTFEQDGQLQELAKKVATLSEDVDAIEKGNEKMLALVNRTNSGNPKIASKSETCKKSAGLAVTAFVLSGLVCGVLQQLHIKGLI